MGMIGNHHRIGSGLRRHRRCFTILVLCIGTHVATVQGFVLEYPKRQSPPPKSQSTQQTRSRRDLFGRNGPFHSQLQQQEAYQVRSSSCSITSLLARKGMSDADAEASHSHAMSTSPFVGANLLRRCAVMTSSFVVSLMLLMHPMSLPLPQDSSSLSPFSPRSNVNRAVAWASSYGSLSDEQKVVAEAWRLVDNSFLDRTFNHQDWFALRQQYVYDKKYQSMDDAHAAIAKMVATLNDPYTRYLTPSQYQSLVDSATGTLAGIGIEIAVDASTQRIVASDVQEASPAVAAGIRPGDVFVQVDGVPVVTSSSSTSLPATTIAATPDDVASLLRGPVNSKVGVVMERNGQSMDYILQRKPITITAVSSYMANNKVGVIRIKNFSGTTANTVSTAVTKLQKQGATALVLDVRGNPGGLLPGGVDTAGLFLNADTPVVYVVNKAGIVDAQSTYTTGLDTTTPLVVLVDSATASAAEVLSAALQENNRAVVAGSNTFGKGIVQTVRELSNKNGGIAITVARYETPQHHDINKRGVQVDVATAVDCAKTDATACFKGVDNAKLFRKAI